MLCRQFTTPQRYKEDNKITKTKMLEILVSWSLETYQEIPPVIVQTQGGHEGLDGVGVSEIEKADIS